MLGSGLICHDLFRVELIIPLKSSGHQGEKGQLEQRMIALFTPMVCPDPRSMVLPTPGGPTDSIRPFSK